jgi:hypothetical protein
MPQTRIDHIAITSSSLEAGSDFVHQCLGLRPLPGGAHTRMGTHNLLLRLGDSMFLEVLAIDPAMPRPPRPRWFGLDELAPDASPRLSCWVARTENVRESAPAASEALGTIEPMSRGSLQWLITIQESGGLLLGGVAPELIQWPGPDHPATSMKDLGCSLRALELLHPEPQRVTALLSSLGFSEPSASVSVRKSAVPSLVAHIDTPGGRRTIGEP